MGQCVGGNTHVNSIKSCVRAASYQPVYPRYFRVTLTLILLMGLGLRLWDLGGASLWTDEVMSAYRAESPLSESLQSIMRTGNQMPLYYFVLRAMPSKNDTTLRLPSAILGVLGIVLLVLMVLRLYGSYDLALYTGALLASNPFHVWLSRTARYYTLVFVLALIISYCFLWLLRGNRSRPVWIVFTLASMAAYMTHYTTLALPAVQLFVIVLVLHTEDRRFFWQWSMAQFLTVIPVVVWLWILTKNPPEIGPEWVPVPDLLDIPRTLWHMTIGYSTSLSWDIILGRLAVTGALASGIIYAAHHRWPRHESIYWLTLVVAPLIIVFTISAFVVSFYVDRYFMTLLPGLILLLALGIQQLPRSLGQVVLAAIIVVSVTHVLDMFDSGDHDREDWYNATAFIAQHARPDDGVVVDRANIEKAFLRYYPTSQSDALALTRLDVGPDTTCFEQSVGRIWVVYRNPHEDVHREGVMPPFNPFEPDHTPMGDWLIARRDLVVLQHAFNGVTVLLLDPSGAKYAIEQED